MEWSGAIQLNSPTSLVSMFKLQPLADTRIPKHEYQVITTIVAPLLGGIQSDIVTVFSLQTSNSVGIGCLQLRVQLRLWGSIQRALLGCPLRGTTSMQWTTWTVVTTQTPL